MLTKTTKKGAPYVLVLLYLLGAVPIFLGMDLGDVATICLFPGAITKVLANIYAMSVPSRFEKSWKKSGLKISVGLYRFCAGGVLCCGGGSRSVLLHLE